MCVNNVSTEYWIEGIDAKDDSGMLVKTFYLQCIDAKCLGELESIQEAKELLVKRYNIIRDSRNNGRKHNKL